jgi:hypothetical protein
MGARRNSENVAMCSGHRGDTEESARHPGAFTTWSYDVGLHLLAACLPSVRQENGNLSHDSKEQRRRTRYCKISANFRSTFISRHLSSFLFFSTLSPPFFFLFFITLSLSLSLSLSPPLSLSLSHGLYTPSGF